ncbi:unnamed protein product [Schistosoma turkestanicum]|nr:unnamed protein product [Schistosoma turkestanicum]
MNDSSATTTNTTNNKHNSSHKSINIKNHFLLMEKLVHCRFFANSDLNAYGLPPLYHYTFLDLSYTSSVNNDGHHVNEESEILRRKIDELTSVMYNAAHKILIMNHTAEALLPSNTSIVSTHLSQSFLQLSIPKLYYLADSVVKQLTIEMFNAQLSPIMEVNQFIFELNKRLSDLLPHPMRICFPSRNNKKSINNPRTSDHDHHHHHHCSSSLHVTSTNRHGFYTYSERKSILLFLNYIGTILHVNYHKLLKNYIFLSPSWLLNAILTIMIHLHNKQLLGMFNNYCTLLINNTTTTTTIVQQEHPGESVQYSPDIRRLRHQVGDNNHMEHDDSSHSKRNLAVINSSYLIDLMKCFIKRTSSTTTNHNNHDHIYSTYNNTIPLEDIFMRLFQQFDLIVSIMSNRDDDGVVDDVHRYEESLHFRNKNRRLTKQLILLPSLLAARCFQPKRLHSYFKPAVIRYKSNYPPTKQRPCLRSQSLDLSTYRSRHNLHQQQPVNNVNKIDNDQSQLLSWCVHTSVSKEIVRLYAVTYIPPGFWIELNRRLLNDRSLHEICGRIYNLSKLPPKLFEQLINNNSEHNDNFIPNYSSNGTIHTDVDADDADDDDDDDDDDVDENIDNGGRHTSSHCNHRDNHNLKPEWTIWKRGMRLSLGHGQIGLARLQQLTRANCALLRNQSLKKSLINLTNTRPLSSPSSSSRAFIPTSTGLNKSDPFIADLIMQSNHFDEWDEPCAIVGEEVAGAIVKQHSNSFNSYQNELLISSNLSLKNNHNHNHNSNNVVYRSGVVETIKHSYESRRLRLLHWIVNKEEEEEGAQGKGVQQQQQQHKHESFQSASPMLPMMMRKSIPELSSSNTIGPTRTVADFKIRHPHGYLTDREHDAFQNSCLIEIYLPNSNIYWEYKQNHRYSMINSSEVQQYSTESVSFIPHNHSRIGENNYLCPDSRAIAELLVKLVGHIDTLLEDWYPDLGVKLNQSNEGVYLVERIIPCSACLATPNCQFTTTTTTNNSHSIDNPLQNMMKRSLSTSSVGIMIHNSFDGINNQYAGNKKLSKSVQFLNYADNDELKQSNLNSSVLSISNDLLTKKEFVNSYSAKNNNNNNIITEEYSTRRNSSNSSKWSWPFKRNRYKRAHSADPLKTTEFHKIDNNNHNKNKNNNDLMNHPPQSTAYTSYVYGISISEYIHWYVMRRNANRLLQSNELHCPVHTSIQLWAPDLQFKDIPSTHFLSAERIHLLQFLGRGAFGSVFSGIVNNSLVSKQQHQQQQQQLLHRRRQRQSLSNQLPPIMTAINQSNDNQTTSNIIPNVAVKLCSPVHPNLIIDAVNSVEVQQNNNSSTQDKRSNSNLSDAFVLYRQEQRRWLRNPIEACLSAYQEIRSELNILLPITRNSSSSSSSSSHPIKFHHDQSSCATLSSLYQKNTRLSKFYAVHPSFLHERRSSQSCFHKCLQKRNKCNSSKNVKSYYDINNNTSNMNSNLLICHGILYPNPIGFVMPLVPMGNLSNYFAALLSSYKDVFNIVNNPAIAANSEVTGTAGTVAEVTTGRTLTDRNELFLSHPIHPITMMLIVNQISKGLAYLHGLSIIHRDLKSENILIWSIPPPPPQPTTTRMPTASTNSNHPSEVHIVLTDYGVSRLMCEEDNYGCRGYVGTPGFMAPEILEYLGEQTYTSKVDIYALGILLCEMIQLEQPYKKSSVLFFRLAQQIISGVRPVIPQHFLKCSPITLIDLMTYCWASDANRRPTAEQIVHLTNPSTIQLLSLSSFNEIPINQNNLSTWKLFTCKNNCFNYIQSVYSIDVLKVVTCAVIDNNYNLWLGGYNHLHESLHNHNHNHNHNNNTNNSSVKSIKFGLLFIIPLDNFSTKTSILLASWPKMYIFKQYLKKFIHDNDFYTKLSDWPIHLSLLNIDDNGEAVKSNNKNSIVSSLLITCLTYFGELRIYKSNIQNTSKYSCLLKFKLSQHYSTLYGNSFQPVPIIQQIGCCIMHHCKQNNNSDCRSSSSSTAGATAATLFILCLLDSQICIVKICISSNLALKFERVVLMSAEQQKPIYVGVILPEICGSHVWLSQNDGKLLCYTWDDSDCGIHSSSTTTSSTSTSSSSSCLKLHSYWFVPSLFNSKSPVVTHFLIGNSIGTDNRQECLCSEVDQSEHVCVWTYLEPDGKLDCWSAISQTLLKSISLTYQLDSGLYTKKLLAFEIIGSVSTMNWLYSSSSSSNILLLTTHGYLIHINLIKCTQNVNSSISNHSTTTYASYTPMTTTTTQSRSPSSLLSSSPSSSSSSSSTSSCQLLHYHGTCSNKDFSLIIPLTQSTLSSQAIKENIPKCILTISKGYINPLNCITPHHCHSTSIIDSTSFRRDFTETTTTMYDTSNIDDQEKFYLVKLFCDQFLFP